MYIMYIMYIVSYESDGPAGDRQMELCVFRRRYLIYAERERERERESVCVCVCECVLHSSRPALRHQCRLQPTVNLTAYPHSPLHIFLRVSSAMGGGWRCLGCDAVSLGKVLPTLRRHYGFSKRR